MKFSDFYGQSSLAKDLQLSFSQGRVAHGFLFTGPEGSGKKTLASICAQALLCSSLGAEKPCGSCGPCKRVVSGSHPDYIDVKTQTVQIGIDAVRSLISTLSEKSFEGGNRAVLITKPMTFDAQNALLKTLEEPPSGTVFFITAVNTSALLPTVISRVQLVALSPLDEKTCTQALLSKGVHPEKAPLLARLSGGIVGKALKMQEDTDYWRARELAYELMRLSKGADLPGIMAKLAKANIDGREFISCVESILSDVIRFHNGAVRIEIDKLSETESIAAKVGVDKAVALLDGTAQALRMINSYIPLQAALQPLAFRLLEVANNGKSDRRPL
ncbi:MAG: ATP-binding protein [Christensenellales bacterium]|jgi:DNA polymerase-3 subunit delta'